MYPLKKFYPLKFYLVLIGVCFKKSFQPNMYFNVTNQIKEKIKALKFYKSEIRKYPHSRSLKALEALAKVRGVASGCKYAEAFIIVRKGY